MTTSQAKSILSEVLIRGEPIPARTLVYFRRRLANRLHALVLERFSKLEAEDNFTRAELGRRIGREPAQITRWLGGGGNWTTETISDLLLGMGCEPMLGISSVGGAYAQQPSENSVNDLPTQRKAETPAGNVFPLSPRPEIQKEPQGNQGQADLGPMKAVG